MRSLATLLRCDTLEDCRRIQRGYLPLRRLGKWSVLFTVAITILINDAIAYGIDRATRGYQQMVDEVDRVTGSVLYRWTFGWFQDPPQLPEPPDRLIALYTFLNGLQFAIFLGWCAYCLRWVYADCRVEEGGITFSRFCWIALVTNLVVYLILKTLFVVFVEWS